MKFYPYPLTICVDRYSGAYSGGEFTAWNLDANEVPEEIHSDDVTCSLFWDKMKFLSERVICRKRQ